VVVRGALEITYHRGGQPSRVVYNSEGFVEVIEVYFTLRLKLVEKIEETERKDGARAIPSCWKPASAKELTPAGDRRHSMVRTKAVSDLHYVGTGSVEECKVLWRGWERTGITDVVTELIQHAQLEE
jgi:hypothetical protein